MNVIKLLIGGGVGLLICIIIIAIKSFISKRGQHAKTKTTTQERETSQAPVAVQDFGFDSLHYELPGEVPANVKSDPIESEENKNLSNRAKKLENQRRKRSPKKSRRYR